MFQTVFQNPNALPSGLTHRRYLELKRCLNRVPVIMRQTRRQSLILQSTDKAHFLQIKGHLRHRQQEELKQHLLSESLIPEMIQKMIKCCLGQVITIIQTQIQVSELSLCLYLNNSLAQVLTDLKTLIGELRNLRI